MFSNRDKYITSFYLHIKIFFFIENQKKTFLFFSDSKMLSRPRKLVLAIARAGIRTPRTKTTG